MINWKEGRNNQLQAMAGFFYDNHFLYKEKLKKTNLLSRSIKLSGFCLLIITTVFSISTLSIAADWRLVPKIAMNGGYDDNVFFSADNQIHSSIVNIKPGVELDYESLLSTLRISADYDVIRYLDESDLDREDQDYRMKGDQRLGERWKARTDLRYTKDSTLKSYLDETGRLIDRLNRNYFSGLGGIDYNLSQVSSIATEYQYANAQYEGDLYSDYDSHSVDLMYQHHLKNEKDTISIGPSYYRRLSDRNTTDYVSLNVRWDRDWSEITHTLASIGTRYATVEDNNGEKDHDWGARARFDLSRQGIVSKITFRYYHDLETTADGEDVNVDNFYLKYNYLLTERFGVGANGRLVFSYNLSGNQNEARDSRYYSIEPFLYYQFTEKLSLYLYYTYQNSSEDLSDGVDNRERNQTWIELTYEFPMML